MNKKRKIMLGLLAVLIVFCFCYTRPRNFEKLVGDGKIKYISMIAMESGPSFNAWGIDGSDEHGEVIDQVEEILKAFKYRTSLRNLLPFSSANNSPGEGNISVNVNISLDDGSFFWISCRGSAAVFHFDNQMAIQTSDGNISQKLFDYTQEYGYKIENKS